MMIIIEVVAWYSGIMTWAFYISASSVLIDIIAWHLIH